MLGVSVQVEMAAFCPGNTIGFTNALFRQLQRLGGANCSSARTDVVGQDKIATSKSLPTLSGLAIMRPGGGNPPSCRPLWRQVSALLRGKQKYFSESETCSSGFALSRAPSQSVDGYACCSFQTKGQGMTSMAHCPTGPADSVEAGRDQSILAV